MSLTPILPFLHVQVPLVVGLNAEGAQIQALCLSPVNTLQFRVLEHRTMTDLNAFQESWIRAVDAHACRHDHVAVAVPRYYRDPHGVRQWLYETGVQMEEYPVLLTDDWLRAEAATWGLPEALAPALCLAQTAVYRRFGSQISCHLWLEMLRLQDGLRSTRRRLRRLMVAQLDSAPPPEYPLEVPF